MVGNYVLRRHVSVALNEISDHTAQNDYLIHCDPILMHFFTFSLFKVYYFVRIASASYDIKLNANK